MNNLPADIVREGITMAVTPENRLGLGILFSVKSVTVDVGAVFVKGGEVYLTEDWGDPVAVHMALGAPAIFDKEWLLGSDRIYHRNNLHGVVSLGGDVLAFRPLVCHITCAGNIPGTRVIPGDDGILRSPVLEGIHITVETGFIGKRITAHGGPKAWEYVTRLATKMGPHLSERNLILKRMLCRQHRSSRHDTSSTQ